MTTAQKIQTGIDKAAVVFNKPDNKFWKKVGNIMIYIVIPIAQIAAIFVPEPYKSILREIVPIVSVAIKGSTKFTTK